MMDYKRIIGGIVLGAVFGGICVFLAKKCITICQLEALEIFYGRLLLGLVIGLLGDLKISFLVRGGLLGILVSLAVVIHEPSEILLFSGAGLVIGVIIDLILTKSKFFKLKS